MFHHLLVTRFNLRNPEWDVTKNNEKLLTEDWMQERMWFFENFYFPTFVTQTNQDFNSCCILTLQHLKSIKKEWQS